MGGFTTPLTATPFAPSQFLDLAFLPGQVHLARAVVLAPSRRVVAFAGRLIISASYVCGIQGASEAPGLAHPEEAHNLVGHGLHLEQKK